MYWAVAQTESQREHVAERWLKERRFEVYLPRMRIERHLRGRCVDDETPLFPGYLFIGIVDRWYSISSTIGVVHLLTDGGAPARVSDAIIAELRAREGIDGLIQLQTRPRFQRGDRIRIVRGAFQGQIAIFADMKPRKRVELLLHILGAERSIITKRRDIRRLNGLA